MRQPIWIIAATLSELHYNTCLTLSFYRIISATKNIFNHCSVRYCQITHATARIFFKSEISLLWKIGVKLENLDSVNDQLDRGWEMKTDTPLVTISSSESQTFTLLSSSCSGSFSVSSVPCSQLISHELCFSDPSLPTNNKKNNQTQKYISTLTLRLLCRVPPVGWRLH